MKQQIVVSGIGGQGALFLTRVIAQSAVDQELPVLTSETHGMAQRGGTVMSTLKIGAYHSPLIRIGQADIALLLWDRNLDVHGPFLRTTGELYVNSEQQGPGQRIDATDIARKLGNGVLANLVLLGLAVRHKTLFCGEEACVEAIGKLAPAKYRDLNLRAFYSGLNG